MIPRADIIEWRASGHSWKTDAQVEQDLIISRMLVELFSSSLIAEKLIFRGGTALHKLCFPQPLRYSEDIDLVQSTPGPIGPIFDSDWEAELCRIAESHPKVRAYIKNHCLGFEVPYRYGSEIRRYRPDFIVMVDDGRKDPLHLIVEIKGYRREDAKEKKAVMETYWVPGINHLGTYGRWAFAEFTDVYEIESSFCKMIEDACMEEV